MQQKYELGTRLTYFWPENDKKIFLNFIFVFEPARFWQIKLIQSVVGLVASLKVLGSHFQDPGCQGFIFQGPRVPESQVLDLMVPGFRVSGSQVSGSQGSGSQSLLVAQKLSLFGEYPLSNFKATLLKRDSGTGVFLCILRKF